MCLVHICLRRRRSAAGYWRPRRQDRLEEQRAILDTLVEANAEHQARIAMDAPVLQATGQLLADTEVALQEARENYDRVAPATANYDRVAPATAPPISPETAPATAPATAPETAPATAPDDAAAGPPEATRTDRRDRDRDPPRDRSRSRERRDRRRRG